MRDDRRFIARNASDRRLLVDTDNGDILSGVTECTRSHASPVRTSIDGEQLMVFDVRTAVDAC